MREAHPLRIVPLRKADALHAFLEILVAVENLRYTTFLDRGHLVEMHVIERIEDIVVQICFFKFHYSLFTIHYSLFTFDLRSSLLSLGNSSKLDCSRLIAAFTNSEPAGSRSRR